MENHSLNQQDPDQNQQRNNGSVVGDSASMTIEFLRARLLAERSVSRTARQRADELAKRIVELEEQLKIVSLQRKKAEKATADVLAILEDRGVSDFSEEFDSNSDQEVDRFKSKMEHNYPEEENLAGSKMERNQTDKFSGSEIETSLTGRNFSWKSSKDSQVSDRSKLINSSSKMRIPFSSSFASTRRSTSGKSCRRIRPRETRSTAEERTYGSTQAPQENGDTASTEGCLTSSSSATETPSNSSEIRNLNIVIESSGDLEGRQPEALLSNHLNVHNSNREMEKALEHQAQLIGQFEEEEEAQREWEKKFRENNSSPVSCEHGTTRSDLTEEREETKANSAPSPVRSNGYIDLEAKSNVENVVITERSLSTSKLSGHEPSPCLQPDVRYFQDREKSSISLSKGKAIAGLKTKIHDPVPRDVPDKVGSVLEALQKAKLSLNHKLIASPQLNSRSQAKAIEFPAKDKSEVPFGCAALFKVPSDFYPENATQNSNLLGSNSRLSFTNSYTNEGNALNFSNRLISSHSSETVPRFPSVQPRIGTTLDASLSHPNDFTHSDLNINRGLPVRLDTSVPFPSPYAYNSGNTDTYNIHTSSASPTNPLYADPMQRMPYSGQQPPSSTDMYFVPLRTPYGVDRPFSSTGMNHVPSSYASLNYPLYTDPRPQVPSGGERLYSSTGNEVGRADHSFYYHTRPNMNK